MPSPVSERLPDSQVASAVASALAVVRRNARRFVGRFPDDTTRGGVYPLRPAHGGFEEGDNRGWTTGFWTGMCWLAWQLSGDAEFRCAAEAYLPDFAERVERRRDVDTHDLGFVYTLSCVAPWRLTGDQNARRTAIAAADRLMDRLLEPAGIIQAWGELSDPAQRGRTIVDSLMNTPLLYWAGETTGEDRYTQAAHRHAGQLRDRIVRPDGTTFHTFSWDPSTGVPLGGSTHQGHSDDSCWARGQAWAVYGFVLNYAYTRDDSLLDTACRCADYFLAHLPEDRVPYWDLAFGDGSGEPRDSSAAAIAVAGLHELAAALPPGPASQRYQDGAEAMLASLIEGYATTPDADALLLHGVYNRPIDLGVDEGNLWGDYFYLEALTRAALPNWHRYW